MIGRYAGAAVLAAALAALMAVLMVVPAGAGGPGSRVYQEAEDAVRAFRDRTFLVTDCEAAFSRFWRLFRAGDTEALVYQPAAFGGRAYFGFGNPVAEPLLAEASAVCQHQSGHRGDMIVRVLRDRERAKEWRHEQAQHAERLIKGF